MRILTLSNLMWNHIRIYSYELRVLLLCIRFWNNFKSYIPIYHSINKQWNPCWVEYSFASHQFGKEHDTYEWSPLMCPHAEGAKSGPGFSLCYKCWTRLKPIFRILIRQEWAINRFTVNCFEWDPNPYVPVHHRTVMN